MTVTIHNAFEKCRQENRAAFMPFLTSGYPSEAAFVKLLRTVIASGADLIEVGVPFSDPLADGRTIQKSSETALANGINIDKTLTLAKQALAGHSVPLVMMSYINPILAFGAERLMKQMHRAGFRGLIVPDLVPDEGGQMERLCQKHEIDLIYLLALTSDNTRRKVILKRSRGFVYLVSVTGVTGARKALSKNLKGWIRQVKTESPQPVCVGFGISSPRQVQELSGVADGIIVGSALVDIIDRASGSRQMIEDIESFVSSMKRQL